MRDHRQEHPHPGRGGSSGRGDVPRWTRGPGRLRPDHGPGDGWRRTDLCGGRRQPGAARDRSGWPGDHPGGDGGSLGVGSCAHGREGWPGWRCHLRRRHPGAGPGPRHGLSVRFRRPLPPEGRHPGGNPRAGRNRPGPLGDPRLRAQGRWCPHPPGRRTLPEFTPGPPGARGMAVPGGFGQRRRTAVPPGHPGTGNAGRGAFPAGIRRRSPGAAPGHRPEPSGVRQSGSGLRPGGPGGPGAPGPGGGTGKPGRQGAGAGCFPLFQLFLQPGAAGGPFRLARGGWSETPVLARSLCHPPRRDGVSAASGPASRGIPARPLRRAEGNPQEQGAVPGPPGQDPLQAGPVPHPGPRRPGLDGSVGGQGMPGGPAAMRRLPPFRDPDGLQPPSFRGPGARHEPPRTEPGSHARTWPGGPIRGRIPPGPPQDAARRAPAHQSARGGMGHGGKAPALGSGVRGTGRPAAGGSRASGGAVAGCRSRPTFLLVSERDPPRAPSHLAAGIPAFGRGGGPAQGAGPVRRLHLRRPERFRSR